MKILEVVRDCPMCGKTSSVILKNEEVDGIKKYWTYGNTNIQDALPNTEPAVREFIKSCYCKKCMKTLFNNTSDRIMSGEDPLSNVGIFSYYDIEEIESEKEIQEIYDTDFSIRENLENFIEKYVRKGK